VCFLADYFTRSDNGVTDETTPCAIFSQPAWVHRKVRRMSHYVSGEVNLGLSEVLSMTMGIIVNDTVHFLSKYRHVRMSGNDAEQSLRYAFASVGRALWITTLVLASGFSILMLSPFALNSDMGMLASIIIVIALAVDFFFTTILMAFDMKNTKQALTHE
jgi:predicted RND superfamily exporter protein